MALNAWTQGQGTAQGRIAPSTLPPAEGSFVFELGSDVAGNVVTLNLGDYSEISQVADLTGLKLLRATAQIRPPAAIPAGTAWKCSLLVDGAERASQRLSPGHPRRRADLGANVAFLAPGNHTIAFRLELVAG